MQETLLQFGGGNFLRAFVDLFLHEANSVDDVHGRAVVVTSTESSRTQWINEQAGCYHVAVRGLRDGATVDETVPVTRAISRSLSAAGNWADVLQVARSPELRWITSNTTEAGLALDPADTANRRNAALNSADTHAPVSFPAKLLAVLAHRMESGLPPVTVLPCELIEDNGPVLLDLLRRQAEIWQLPQDLRDAINQCPIPSTLVDRIVSGRPDEHPLLAKDRLLTVAEPYASWVIEQLPNVEPFPHPAVSLTGDVADFSLRKVRILNGVHTALVCKTAGMDIVTVGDAIAHPTVGPWLHRLLFEEILPVVHDRIVDGESFAATTLERFANPFLRHRLADIALHHQTKVTTRLLPTYHEYLEMFGESPPLLGEILQPYLLSTN
jgi:tagaturonate reductase